MRGALRVASLADTVRYVTICNKLYSSSKVSTASSAVHLIIRALFHCDHIVYAQYCDRRLCGKLHDTKMSCKMCHLCLSQSRNWPMKARPYIFGLAIGYNKEVQEHAQ